MSILADVAAIVRARVADLNVAIGELYTARSKIERAHWQMAAATRGTDDAGLSQAIAELVRCSVRVDHGASLVIHTTENLAYFSTTVLGFPLSADGSGRPLQQPEYLRPDAVPTWVHDVASTVHALMPGGGKTAGVLALPDGRTRSKPIWSGRQGPGAGAPGLRRDDKINQWPRLKSAVEHVEGHAAAFMRRAGAPTEAVLVVSQPPCPGPYGCNAVLPALLPVNSRLTVYLASADGQARLWKTYIGTGEGTVT
ncbi:DddA-like double-stranded DNA deaminase toxin [Micromonospora sp. LOL_021]|uniref:DddA-like double-stranded DNA deaminase toxin n=1 Tax=Micromonospora sp. LOL_021 TaxID=3345417 RepID=UPI003A862795